MSEITFRFDIDADRAKVLDALNTHDGLTGWWTTGVDRTSESLFFDFPGIPQPFELRRDAASEDLVTWTSVGAFPPHWKDTVITWRMTGLGDSGGTQVLFRHAGFPDSDPDMPGSAYTWGQLMVRLKDFAETGRPQPFFTLREGFRGRRPGPSA
ncbi:SRPBCC domain-containing protein [Kitasatospora aureofaciens]|uniref:SRPBCC family protein n=1 Tax=Kitasatospora aureofaciens TaxID=1894 RepID=UPI00380AC39B